MLKLSCILVAADGPQHISILKLKFFRIRFVQNGFHPVCEFSCQSTCSYSWSNFSDIIKQTWRSEIRLHTGFRLWCLSGWRPWGVHALLLVRSALGRPSEREIVWAPIWTQSFPHFELWLTRSTSATSQALAWVAACFRVPVLLWGSAHCKECCQPCQGQR